MIFALNINGKMSYVKGELLPITFVHDNIFASFFKLIFGDIETGYT